MKHLPKLLILSSRFPYPLEKGDKLRLYHQIKHLSSFYRIVLVSLTDYEVTEKDTKELNPFVSNIYILPQSKYRNLQAGINSFLGNKALQITFYFERSIQKKIDLIIKSENPDILFAQLIRMAPFLASYSIPKFLDYMDAMSLNMDRESKKSIFPVSWLFSRESKLLKKAELDYSKLFHGKSIISNQDKNYLNNLGINELIVQNNGVDLEFFNSGHLDFDPKEIYDIVFVGNMGYLPNVEAAEFLVNNIIKKYFPTLKVLIAGARPHRRVLKLANENITISGWVNDIREAYCSGKIVVAPIFTGAGQQNKILEGMALGRACITTSLVADGLGISSENILLKADSQEAFKKCINLLLNNKNDRQIIGKNARIFVEQNFKWSTQVNILDQALKRILKLNND